MSSDSESDAPEAISLSSAAKSARGRDRSLQAFVAAEKHKTKERNRRRDHHLKEQAKSKSVKTQVSQNSSKKGGSAGREEKGRDVEDEDEEDEAMDADQARLMARMRRAMDEAEDESGGDEDDEFSRMAGLDDLEGLSKGDGENEDEEEGGDDKDGGEDEGDVEGEYEAEELDADMNVDAMACDDGDGDDEEDLSMDEDGDNDLPSSNNRYLPDHLFTVALSKKPTHPSKFTQKSSTSQSSKRRKRIHNKPKDIVVGSRAIRTLPPAHRVGSTTIVTHTPAPGATTPSARINRFLSRALALKGGKKAQGWERRAANIGVLKRSEGAPLTGFVRAR